MTITGFRLAKMIILVIRNGLAVLCASSLLLSCSGDSPVAPRPVDDPFPEAVGWQSQNPKPTEKTIWATYFHNENVGTIVGGSGQIFQTHDGGRTWVERESVVDNRLFAVTFSDSLHGWAVGQGAITATSDGGATWTTLPFPDPSPSRLLHDVSFPDSLHGWVVGFRGALYGTTDGGISWRLFDTGADTYHDDYCAVHFISVAEGWVTGLGYTGGVFHTVDSGATWQWQRGRAGTFVGCHFFPNGQGWIIDLIAVVYTPDGGWTRVIQKNTNGEWLRGICMVDTLTGWVVGEEGLIMNTVDGQTWVEQESGTRNDLKEVWFVNRQEGWVVGEGGIILHTDDGGQSWELLTQGPIDDIFDIDFVDDRNGWAVGYNGTVMHTTNRGWTWIEQESGTDEWLVSLDFVDENNGWVVGTSGTILHTDNGGTTWERQTSNSAAMLFSVHFADPHYGWAVGDDGTILHTDNGGDAWVHQTSNTTGRFWSVFFHDRQRGWAVGYNALKKTIDGGNTWVDIASFPFDPSAWISDVRFINDTTGWLLCPPGTIFRTTDAGKSWTYTDAPTVLGYMTGFIIDENEAWLVGDKYLGGTPPFCYHSTDGWQTWEEVPFYHDNSLLQIFFIDRNIGWMVGDNGCIQHTTTGGLTP